MVLDLVGLFWGCCGLVVNVNINNLICDAFTDIFSDIVTCDVDRVVLNGGRSSTK